MSQRDTLIHLLAGGVAGTAGAVVTCPLEVVKTRLQSSNPVFGNVENSNGPKGSGGNGGFTVSKGRYGTSPYNPTGSTYNSRVRFSTCVSCGRSAHILAVARANHASQIPANSAPKLGLIQCLRLIIEKEGPRALFKGLGPNLVGVAPSRAIYFCSYSQSKKTFNQIFPTESPVVHICSAATAGFVACTATNPVWFVKTRLQLDQNKTQSARDAIRRIYAQGGILGFYKGITASYMGISETVIHFVIYEAVKKRLQQWAHNNRTLADEEAALANPNEKSTADFVQFMAAGAISKTVASCIAYPHEVARTRLREEGTKYRNFWQTLSLVAKEEGYRGLYRGLGTQLIRQIPNTAIMMSTYEATVYMLSKYLPSWNSTVPMEPNDLKDLVCRDDSYDEFTYTELADSSSSSNTTQ